MVSLVSRTRNRIPYYFFKVITFKFNGKTYKVKTNSKGVAQKVLKKNVIKKLKKGKTNTVKVTYLKNTIKSSVKVK